MVARVIFLSTHLLLRKLEGIIAHRTVMNEINFSHGTLSLEICQKVCLICITISISRETMDGEPVNRPSAPIWLPGRKQ